MKRKTERTNPQPTISVCMTTFNGAQFVSQQLESILAQLPLSAELIVVDDASTDETVSLIERFEDPRIKLYRNKTNVGVVKSVERALMTSTKEIIFTADQDDVWLLNKIDTVLNAITQNTSLVVHDAIVTDQQLLPQPLSYFDRLSPSKNPLRNLFKNTLIGAMMAFPRSLINEALPFPERIGMHDIWLGLVASRTGAIELLPDKLIYYRRHINNASPTLSVSKRPMNRRIEERLSTLYHLIRIH